MDAAEKLLRASNRRDRKALVVKTALVTSLGGYRHVAWLVDLVGVEKTVEILLVFGGGTLKLPAPAKFVEALNLAGAGVSVTRGKMSLAEAAKTYRVSPTALKEVVDAVRAVDADMKSARIQAAAMHRGGRKT